MDQLTTFVTNNWILVGALIVILFLLVYSYIGGSLRGYASTSPSEAVKMINREDALVLDVREDTEYQEGHIINAMHLPLSQLNDQMKKLEKHKEQPIIVACRSGQRSGQACATLKKAGFDNVYNLGGGILAWKNANLPLVNQKQSK
ncbi:rhodanese-like domain-containing protein [Thiohalophilus sp.]|uniref:rhodanese-like domain-containing protein n=1 Tax=Thiohalophilus sp. TaxID=3028392 RepID=UPI002ACD2A33|nr:rhodanese-like domain-containing protein [Thiohalophilus sp.]MDZ7803426.1 rhodanese-like domain-containing protein [Thiohalophilus sp.]